MLGRDVNADFVEEMIKKFKSQGMAEAELWEGHKYRTWQSLDYEKAFQHFSIAADKGNAEAMYNVVGFITPSLSLSDRKSVV